MRICNLTLKYYRASIISQWQLGIKHYLKWTRMGLPFLMITCYYYHTSVRFILRKDYNMRKIIVTLLSVIPWLMIIIITGQIDYTNYFSFLGYHVVPLIGLVYSILIGLRPDKFLMNVSKAKNKNMWSTVESIITYIVLFLYATVFLNFFASQRETLIVVGLQTILISNLIGFIFYTIINGLYNNLEG